MKHTLLVSTIVSNLIVVYPTLFLFNVRWGAAERYLTASTIVSHKHLTRLFVN